MRRGRRPPRASLRPLQGAAPKPPAPAASFSAHFSLALGGQASLSTCVKGRSHALCATHATTALPLQPESRESASCAPDTPFLTF